MLEVQHQVFNSNHRHGCNVITSTTTKTNTNSNNNSNINSNCKPAAAAGFIISGMVLAYKEPHVFLDSI